MFPIPAAFSWSSGLSEGTSTFTTIFNAVMDNPLMSGVVMASVVIGLIALVWGVFRH